MPSEPSWWYDERPRIVTAVLRPIATLYGRLAVSRLRRSPEYVSRLPVLCVGNFTAGGTGKTPLTRWLATMLVERGARPAILSRGYGGSVKGPHWVTPADDSAASVGDEPLLLAADAPVLVARDRAAGARTIEADRRGFTHILMDDGLQNPALHKSLSIAVVDGVRGVGNGYVIPAGPLRAPLAVQVARVDIILINHGLATGAPAAHARDELLGVVTANRFTGAVLDASIEADAAVSRALVGRPLFAFAGIGVPDKFFALLRSLDLDVRRTRAFADHHQFTDAETAALCATAAAEGLHLVTTEKDLARIVGRHPALAAVTTALPIRLVMSDRAGTLLIERLSWTSAPGSPLAAP